MQDRAHFTSPDSRTRNSAANRRNDSLDAMKREAARHALGFVQSGMPSRSRHRFDAVHFVELLAERVREGLDIIGVPTSEATRAEAERLGVPLTTLDDEPELDLTVDGADEIDPELNLIKGGGGALLREKIVATASPTWS